MKSALPRATAIFSAVMAALLLVGVVREALRGELLEVKAEHIGVLSVAVLVVWLVAVIYTAWLYLLEDSTTNDTKDNA